MSRLHGGLNGSHSLSGLTNRVTAKGGNSIFRTTTAIEVT